MKPEPSSTTTLKLTEKIMEGTVIWLFWRKVLKLRNYKPIFRVQNIYKTDKGPVSELKYYFERAKNKKILVIHVSKYNGLYFTEAQMNKVYTSPICGNLGQFEAEFKKHFFRRLPILPERVCVLPGNKH